MMEPYVFLIIQKKKLDLPACIKVQGRFFCIEYSHIFIFMYISIFHRIMELKINVLFYIYRTDYK